MEAWKPGKNQFAIFLEDDIEVSEFYFEWIIENIADYKRSKITNILGVSLYTPKLNEISPKKNFWDPYQYIAGSDRFLFQLPCSWGAVYFSDHWKNFQAYYHLRIGRRIDVPIIPGSLSNSWNRSWKK